ncbi:MAG TPA: hypothetical protein DDX98_13025 [Bacteroidales bacterium]|jgi:hypothetical protein|nr:hypothetical protein [Bacteroidales bacterium]
MSYNAQFEQPAEYKLILRDSYEDNTYYGLDEFDCKYLKILQAKFGCYNSYHTIPERVKMEMAPYVWNEERQKYVLDENRRRIIQLNRLENLVVSYKYANTWHDFLSN